MAPVGHIAMQCPQAMQPMRERPLNATLDSFKTRQNDLHTDTQRPQAVQLSASMLMSAATLVREVGIAMVSGHFFLLDRPTWRLSQSTRLSLEQQGGFFIFL